jgi:hypothetical protein
VNPGVADTTAVSTASVDLAALFASADHGNGMQSAVGASAAGYPS